MTYEEEMEKYERERIGTAIVKVMPGQERQVYCSLKGKRGILDIYHVFGEYDFFLIMEAESLAKLNGLVEEIQEDRRVIMARMGLIPAVQDQRPG